jgi:membrane protease YdiL (CAAX protease family)
MFKTVLHDFLNFLKKPDDNRVHLNFRGKVAFLCILFVVEVVLVLVYLPVLTFADDAAQVYYKGDDIDEGQLFLLAVVIMPFLEEVLFRYFLRYERINPVLIGKRKWNILFPFLVYSSAMAFSLVHLSNYEFEFNPDIWFVYPMLVFSQFIGGLVLSFIRVRLNFYFGVAFHMAWNLIFLLLSMVLPD